MRRVDLEHLIRAAAAITNEYELVVIGSQSILGSTDNVPPEVLQSMEADIYRITRQCSIHSGLPRSGTKAEPTRLDGGEAAHAARSCERRQSTSS